MGTPVGRAAKASAGRPAGRRAVTAVVACLAVLAVSCGPSHPSKPTRTTTTTTAPRPPVGGAVPAGFEPGSASFVSAATGFVLGIDTACTTGACVALTRTTDAGAAWVGLPAPVTSYAPRGQESTGTSSAVSQVRFASELDGWLFGPSLFATHDGGRTWQAVHIGGSVIALATSDGYVDAVVSPCTGGASCTGALALEQAPDSGGSFTTVLTGPTVPSASVGNAELSFSSRVGFVSLGPATIGTADLYATSNLADTQDWHAFPDPCAEQGILTLTSFAAPDTTALYSLCSGNGAMGSTSKTVMVTRNGISTVAGTAPLGGDGGSLAATSAGTLLIATASGASWIYRSADGGSTWATTETFDDGGMGWGDIGFVTSDDGFAVHGVPGPPAGETTGLLLTTDAGAIWHQVPIG